MNLLNGLQNLFVSKVIKVKSKAAAKTKPWQAKLNSNIYLVLNRYGLVRPSRKQFNNAVNKYTPDQHLFIYLIQIDLIHRFVSETYSYSFAGNRKNTAMNAKCQGEDVKMSD